MSAILSSYVFGLNLSNFNHSCIGLRMSGYNAECKSDGLRLNWSGIVAQSIKTMPFRLPSVESAPRLTGGSSAIMPTRLPASFCQIHQLLPVINLWQYSLPAL